MCKGSLSDTSGTYDCHAHYGDRQKDGIDDYLQLIITPEKDLQLDVAGEGTAQCQSRERSAK